MSMAPVVREVEQGCTQRVVAQAYAWAIREGRRFAKEANKAILKRWSPAGLERIKGAAWSGRWRGGPLFDEGGPW